MSASAYTQQDAITTARTLAAEFANQAPWSDRGDTDSDDAIGMVAHALNPTIDQRQQALEAELATVITEDQRIRLSEFLGTLAAHHADAGYLFGLAVGQLIRIPALAPRTDGVR